MVPLSWHPYNLPQSLAIANRVRTPIRIAQFETSKEMCDLPLVHWHWGSHNLLQAPMLALVAQNL